MIDATAAHGANQPANRWYQQDIRGVVAWGHLCRPYRGRQGGILAHWLEQGLLTTDDQPRATTPDCGANQDDRSQRARITRVVWECCDCCTFEKIEKW
jgi:hypothetical protein